MGSTSPRCLVTLAHVRCKVLALAKPSCAQILQRVCPHKPGGGLCWLDMCVVLSVLLRVVLRVVRGPPESVGCLAKCAATTSIWGEGEKDATAIVCVVGVYPT